MGLSSSVDTQTSWNDSWKICGLFLFKRNFTSDKVEGEVILHSFSKHFFFEVVIFNESFFINVVMMHGQDKCNKAGLLFKVKIVSQAANT